MITEKIEEKYNEVQVSLENALEKANSIEISGDQENEELSIIRQTLFGLNVDFKEEVEKLKKSSEWEKFCIAFFGETNAGKSTIIESLRIIYDEESRREQALEQEKEYCKLLKKHCEDYQNLIFSLKEVNASLKNQYGKNNKWIFYITTTLLGFVIGLVLANLGIIVW